VTTAEQLIAKFQRTFKARTLAEQVMNACIQQVVSGGPDDPLPHYDPLLEEAYKEACFNWYLVWQEMMAFK
jgi:hypothetical protein